MHYPTIFNVPWWKSCIEFRHRKIPGKSYNPPKTWLPMLYIRKLVFVYSYCGHKLDVDTWNMVQIDAGRQMTFFALYHCFPFSLLVFFCLLTCQVSHDFQWSASHNTDLSYRRFRMVYSLGFILKLYQHHQPPYFESEHQCGIHKLVLANKVDSW